MTPADSPSTILPSTTREHVFPANPRHVGAARAFLAAILDDCPAADDAILCVSELASNAVLHSASRQPAGTFTVCAELSGDGIWIGVKDNGGEWKDNPHGDGRPHGLDIVRELATDTGREGSALTGWLVWAKLAQSRQATTARTQRAAHHLPQLRPGDTLTARSAGPGPSARWTTTVNGHRLRHLRHQHGLSQEQLASRAGISLTTMRRLERQPTAPCRCRTLGRLAAALGEDPARLTTATQP
ncbi:MAG: helix-turn-helix domain-containing protein [Streptosporangiaceae bacterium]